MSISISEDQAIEWLNDYNKIVLRLLEGSIVLKSAELSFEEEEEEETKEELSENVDIDLWRAGYKKLAVEINDLKQRNLAFFSSENEAAIQNLDLFQEENIFIVFVYSAINYQWPSIDPNILFSEDSQITEFDREEIDCVRENINLLLNDAIIQSLRKRDSLSAIKSLTRTLVLHFYIRAQEGNLTVPLELLEHIDCRDDITPIYVNKMCSAKKNLRSFLEKLCQTNVCREAFRGIIKDETDFDAKIYQIFNHVIDNSYFALIPSVLYGFTAWGDYIFVKCEYATSGSLNLGTSLVILLHEMGCLASRLGKPSNSYFKITPKNSDLEENLFGMKVSKLYLGGSVFLMNINNWNLSSKIFKAKFNSAQRISKKKKQPKRIISKGKSGCDHIRFGRCGMSYRSAGSQ